MDLSHCALCVLAPLAASSVHVSFLLCLRCPESFVDSAVGWCAFHVDAKADGRSPCSLQLCPGGEGALYLGLCAADAKCWRSAGRQSHCAPLFRASRSFPSVCGAVCVL